MKDIKDKPDFEEMAFEALLDIWLQGDDMFKAGHQVKAQLEKIWTDYYLPALKRIEELEKQVKSLPPE
jgi:hypothetical protein